MGLFRGGQPSVEQSSPRKSVPAKSTRRTSLGQQLVNSILQKKEEFWTPPAAQSKRGTESAMAPPIVVESVVPHVCPPPMNAASSASAASEQATVTPVLGAADESKMSEAMLRLRRENELRERRAHRAARQEAWIKEGRASSWQRTATSPASKQQRSVAAERRELERTPQTVSI